MNQERNLRTVTEATTGNRRPKTEVTTGNRRSKTEATTGNRRQMGNIYTETWQTDVFGEEADLQKYMLQIASASFYHYEDFQKKVEEAQVLQGYSGRKYKIIGSLPQQGGESLVLLCTDEDEKQVVAKIFKNIEKRDSRDAGYLQKVVQVRAAVIEFSQSEEAKGYVLPIVDIGLVSLTPGTRNYFEIQPYCKSGDLNERTGMSFQELLPVIQHLNEALHRIHQGGLLHLDIKPENLYEYEGNIVVGDFGIAHIQKDGRQVTVDVGGTDGYRSPETVFIPNAKNIVYFLTPAADYYSLGVTIASLYAGHFIYQGIESNMPLFMRESHIPLPFCEDSNQIFLQNLIDGLCQFDSQYRFGYEEIKLWMENHNFKGKYSSNQWPRPYNFNGKACHDEYEFYTALAENWEVGKHHLYRKYIEQFFASFEPGIAQCAYEIVERDYADVNDEVQADIGFFKFLNYLHPNGILVWKEAAFHGLSEMANAVLQSETTEKYKELLEKKIVSMWLLENDSCDKETLNLVREIENLAQYHSQLACYWFAYAFGDTKEVTYLGEKIDGVRLFIKASLKRPPEFYGKSNVLDFLSDRNQSAEVYGFLYSKGYQPLLEPYFEEMEAFDQNEKADFIFQMLDEMAPEDLKPEVRNYYRNYGPMGYLCGLQEMAVSKKVYTAKSKEGQELLRKIAEAEIPEQVSVTEMSKAMKKIETMAEELLNNLQNNPFLSELGIMEEKLICCQNLAGFFNYEFLGKLVPLQYESVLRRG